MEWKPLLHGRAVGQIFLDHPEIIVTKTEPEKAKQDTASFKTMLEKLMPLKVNRFEIKDGTFRFIDNKARPKVDVTVKVRSYCT